MTQPPLPHSQLATALAGLLVTPLLAASSGGAPLDRVPRPGPWRAWLESPGGEIPFELEFALDATSWRATIGNGRERIEVPEMSVDAELAAVTLALPHYDSRIEAQLSEGATRLDGLWKKRRNANEWVEMKFHATAGAAKRFRDDVLHEPTNKVDPTPLARELAGMAEVASGRFAIQFASDADPAVGLFEVTDDGRATGTFLTTAGDYRYLAGSLDRGWPGDDGLVGCEDDGEPHYFLRLSCFDGAHAFLFTAELDANGAIGGSFWAADRWHETWTGRRDDSATLPDGFALSRASGAVPLDELTFLDLDGKARRLTDPAFAGKVRLLQVFGSWCPNCHDACDELVRLQREYGGRGLSIVGLAFELTGEVAHDAEQVRRYAKRHGATWPMLLAGTSDKQAATASLGLLDRVRAYPTTLFLDAKGAIRAVFTGFNGPATGAAHDAQRDEFSRVLENLLREQ